MKITRKGFFTTVFGVFAGIFAVKKIPRNKIHPAYKWRLSNYPGGEDTKLRVYDYSGPKSLKEFREGCYGYQSEEEFLNHLKEKNEFSSR